MYHSFDVLSARFTWPTALFAAVFVPQEVCKVPDVKLVPAANQKSISKDAALSLSNAPVVSPAKVIVFFSQVSAEEIV